MSSSVSITRNGNPAKGGEEGALKAVIETCNIIINNAKALAPVNRGRLRNSLMYRVNSGTIGEEGFNNGGGERANDREKVSLTPVKKATGFAGTNVFYGVYQEFGTRHHAPQPYLRPAGAIARGQSTTEVIKKIQQEEMLGALKLGQKRVTF